MSIETEICILGAGPGGAFTALTLAQQGVPCVLVDKAIFPRDKICGDALSGKVVEVFRKVDPTLVDRLAADPEHLGSWGVSFVAPSSKVLRVPFQQNFNKADQAPGFISKRIDFDQFLIEECKKCPQIQFLEGHAIDGFEKTSSGWKLTNHQGREDIHTRLVIAADGAYSRFAKQVGGIHMEPKHYRAGLRAYYKGVEGMDPDQFIELHFLKDLLPGYFWIFPLPNGWANVGVGMRSDVVRKQKVDLKKRMFQVIETYPELRNRFANAELVDKVQGFGLPLGSRKRPISGEGYLLVGDAASLIDPFTGEGIGNALYSGYFAAQQALQSRQTSDFSASTLAQYDRSVYARLWDELKLSRRMQQLVRFPWLFNFVVNKANKNKVLRETISCMFEDLDLRDRLRKPSFYFNLLFANEHGRKS